MAKIMRGLVRADEIGVGTVVSTYPHLTDADHQTVFAIEYTPKYVRITRKTNCGVSQTDTYAKSRKIRVTNWVKRTDVKGK